MMTDSRIARIQSHNLLIGRKSKLKLRLKYPIFTQRRAWQDQTSITNTRGKFSEENPTLSSPICPRWETPDPDPDRLIPEDAFSDPPTDALSRYFFILNLRNWLASLFKSLFKWLDPPWRYDVSIDWKLSRTTLLHSVRVIISLLGSSTLLYTLTARYCHPLLPNYANTLSLTISRMLQQRFDIILPPTIPNYLL
ncbi:hypothetical protein LINGRAPRIM_LOCUS2799, partial [Linum grandiflorum]